ncbi:MAG TPA: hypothetical protein VK914_10700 [bacterium]|jgi:putative membrane protein|nr:hypothetical protein [bacterium]
MSELKHLLDHAQRERIEAALRAADIRSCGEIIPVVARRSAHYGHVSWLAAALCLALVESLGLGREVPAVHQHPDIFALTLALFSAAAGWLLAQIPSFRRALTPKADRLLAVHRAAEAAFHHLALHRARHDAGVLLYVSLEERQAVVLAGPGIADLAGAAHWKHSCSLLTAGAADGDLTGGFEKAIAHTAEVLAQHHPPLAGGASVVLAPRLRVLHEGF